MLRVVRRDLRWDKDGIMGWTILNKVLLDCGCSDGWITQIRIDILLVSTSLPCCLPPLSSFVSVKGLKHTTGQNTFALLGNKFHLDWRWFPRLYV